MIDQGAHMEAHDCHYGTPLHVACARQHYDCAKVLLNAGESRGLYHKAGFELIRAISGWFTYYQVISPC